MQGRLKESNCEFEKRLPMRGKERSGERTLQAHVK